MICRPSGHHQLSRVTPVLRGPGPVESRTVLVRVRAVQDHRLTAEAIVLQQVAQVARPDVTMQPARRQSGKCFQPLRQIRPEPGGQSFTRFPRPIDRRFQSRSRYFRTVLRSSPVCRAIALTPRPCRCNSRIITISLNPTTCAPFPWHQQEKFCAADDQRACPLIIGSSAKLGDFHPALLRRLRPAPTMRTEFRNARNMMSSFSKREKMRR